LNSCWKIDQRPSAERTITKFSHTPHLTIPALSDCQSCHVLYSQSSSVAGTHGWSQSGMILHHEFQSMLLQNCSKCHTKESAGDSCTQCHNYHVHTYQEDAMPRPTGASNTLQSLR
jgi:ribosomal protein L32